MEQRFANTWRMTVNEKKFIENALLSDLRVDGRRPFDYRHLTVSFGREDGSSEVQLGQTRVMGVVTSQLLQPYRDRPNEGTLSIYTEFSPMADPSFETGRPGEFAVELGRIIDRGLRESRAVDTESLCVVAGKFVWSIRVDLHILDNGGNLVDAANIAALAALLTFRRPECTLGGEDGQEVIIHPPEAIDPTHYEEAVMGGRMTATLNSNGDVCAVQKAGGEGIMQSVIMQCLRIASVKATDITSKIKNAVEAYNTERTLRKIKRHPTSVAVDVNGPDIKMRLYEEQSVVKKEAGVHPMVRFGEKTEESCSTISNGIESETQTSQRVTNAGVGDTKSSIGGPSTWDPYSKGIDLYSLRTSLASSVMQRQKKEQKDSRHDKRLIKVKAEEPALDVCDNRSAPIEASGAQQQVNEVKTLKDAVKPKNKRKEKVSSTILS
ncbi:exosome complex component RRP45A-like isoform X2 [Telopea speciosissima]|uniref:exosome complex component RRP45A-like isoform X2 n=1 Tax=Telopea speciosissima TaxID=54955 RepID=UPI001CC65912|nr:exosome complex component RRP45A-like isoform X2 [Telopea speciosissima]